MDFRKSSRNLSMIVLATMTLVGADDNSFVFPDEGNSHTEARYGNNGNQFINQQREPPRGHFGVGYNGNTNYQPSGSHPRFDGVNYQPAPQRFGGHKAHNGGMRPWHNIVHQGPSNIYGTGNEGGSVSNAQSNAQTYSGYGNTNSQASSQSQSQGWGNSNYPGNGPSSASSAASATTGIVNGVPVAAASAAAASASGGNNAALSSSLATSQTNTANQGGYNQINNQNIPPWFFRGRIGEDNKNEMKAKSDDKNTDRIIFDN